MLDHHAQSIRGLLLILAVLTVLVALPSWCGATKVEIDLFEGLIAGTLEDDRHGWTRSVADDKDGAAPDWWVRFQLPENAPPYLEIYQDVWNNGPNLLVTRELPGDESARGWQLAGRMKVVNAPENSFFLRVLDDANKAIASLDRFTINHKQGKKGPGDSYFKFNDVPVLATKATGKAKWSAIMKFTTGDWKPFKVTLAAEKPEVLVLEYGDRTITVPLPPAEVHATTPKTLQIFFGWGLGAQRTGGIFLENLTFTVDRGTEKTARSGD